ncbi:MAG: HAMP domain-containing histidine kinase [Chlorobi bacterium]|nr:HAMP domain-containing histidine kinase [Chlorobiota bacterium]
MNLLTKTSLLITTVALFILMIGGIIFFEITKELINKQVDRELISEMHSVIHSFGQLSSSTDTVYYDNVTIIPTTKQLAFNPVFKDTIRFNDFEGKFHSYRTLIIGYRWDNKNYIVEIYKSLLDATILIESVTLVWISLSFVLILAIFFLNKIIFKRTWKDFFDILQIAESYDIKKPEKKIILKDSEINEFTSLNQVLSRLLDRVETDYQNQKELTANTSHELQTPLAIIKSKAELLMQGTNLNTEQIHLISEILQTTDRLSKLNRSLLTISKIESNQFTETEVLDVAQIIKSHIQQFQEFIDERNHTIETAMDKTRIKINPLLLDLLLFNLLGNAIMHNYNNGGKIYVTCKNGLIKIANTGTEKALPEKKIFQRYFKHNSSPQSSGIGLSIVRKICDYYEIDIVYSFVNNLHTFILDISKLKEEG